MHDVQSFSKRNGIMYSFSHGKITLDGDTIDAASRNAVKAILTSLPEGKRTQEIVKFTLSKAIDLLKEQQVEM